MPMAIACFRSVTFSPEPDFSVPFLNRRITRVISSCALGERFLPEPRRFFNESHLASPSRCAGRFSIFGYWFML